MMVCGLWINLDAGGCDDTCRLLTVTRLYSIDLDMRVYWPFGADIELKITPSKLGDIYPRIVTRLLERA